MAGPKKKAFSMNFKLLKTIGRWLSADDDDSDQLNSTSSDDQQNSSSTKDNQAVAGRPLQFNYPADVKIAYLNHCLVVSDDQSRRILFIDLESYQLKTIFELEQTVTDIFIVESGGGGNEYIYFGDEGTTYKINIAPLLKHDRISLKHVTPEWSIKEDLNGSIVMVYDKTRKQRVFLRNNHTNCVVDVRSDIDGSLIRTIELQLCTSPGLFALSNSEILILQHESSTISKITLNLDEEHAIESREEVINTAVGSCWGHPLCATVDSIGNRIFLSDYGNNRIVVLDRASGNKEIAEYKGVGGVEKTKLSPFGLQLDYNTGLLYVVDQQASTVKIYE